MLCLENATVLTPERRIEAGRVVIDAGRIVAVGAAGEVARPADAAVVDADGGLLAPGFIDLQVNGGFGHDFTAAPEMIWTVAAGLPRYGVTAFLPTIITSPPERLAAARAALAAGPPAGWRGAAPLGLHVEGPFLNPARRGAHNPAYLRLPDPALAADWSPEQGVRLATLAPELPGALALIAALTARGVVVSAGHSAADYEAARAGIAAGVAYGTHLFNAMGPLHHREPGLAGALLGDGRCVVGLIADGLHVHPAVVALAWRLKGAAGLTLVSDAMAALGAGPGRYRLNDLMVTVTEQGARLEDGTLAGSTLALDAALRNLLVWTGCDLAAALATATTTPATVLGLAGARGRIAPGYVADLVLLTPALEVVLTIAAGEIIYRGAGAPS